MAKKAIPVLVALVVIAWAYIAYLVFSEQPDVSALRTGFLLGTVALIILGGVLWAALGSGGRSGSNAVDEFVEALARGDITRQFDESTVSRVGGLASHLNLAAGNLRKVLSRFSRDSVALDKTASALDVSEKKMSDGIEQVVAQLNSAAAASEQLSATSEEITRNCGVASESSQLANQVAVDGTAIVNKTVSAMNDVAGIVNDAANVVKQLGARSDEIGQIVELIRGIASQTNLLALNAAIEAARAGDHGRGFAVVSDEVRKLAGETSDATAQIAATVEAMQEQLGRAVQSMEEGIGAVQEGTEEAGRSGVALQNILTEIEKVVNEIHQIEGASVEQNNTTEALSKNLQEIALVMDENAKSITGNVESVKRLSALAKGMKQLIGGFKLVTQEDAKSLVEKAVNYIKDHGREKAFAEFNDPQGSFVDGELFIFAQRYGDGYMYAYGGGVPLAGKFVADAKDADGKPIAQPMIDIAKKGGGWYTYRYFNPHTDREEPKLTYIQPIGDDTYLACGIYQSELGS